MADPFASIDRAKTDFMRDVRAAMTSACDESARLLLDEMKRLTARIDHDLNELRRMGHPYGWGKGRRPGVPHSDWIVHNQRGDLQGGLKMLPPQVSQLSVTSDILSQAKHTWYLLLGTVRMRPRDFVSAAILFRQREVERIFERHFLAAHDRSGTVGQSLSVRLIPHEEYPAQLPEGPV